MSDKKFQFHVPVELIKSNDQDDDAIDSWQIKGIASTGDEDLQGETVDQNGMDISVLRAGRGLFNWDHQKGPENVIGQIEDAEFVKQGENTKALMVKGYLFKHQKRAEAFYNILRSVKKSSGNRVHLSIEGKILERDFRNHKSIRKARVEKVALTLDPVNPYTFAELCKSLAAPEANVNTPEVPQVVETSDENQEVLTLKRADVEILTDLAEKALAAGAGYAGKPTDMSGGEPMTKESLESRVKKVTYGKKKKNKKEMLKSLIDSAISLYPDHDPIEVAKMVVDAALRKKD